MFDIIKLFMAPALTFIVLGCSESSTEQSESPAYTETVQIVDGYILEATVTDGTLGTAVEIGDGLYAFSAPIEGNVTAANGYFKENNVSNKMLLMVDSNVSHELNTSIVVSPITTMLTLHPETKAIFLNALATTEIDLYSDFIQGNNMQLAQVAQLIYVMDASGYTTLFIDRLLNGYPPFLITVDTFDKIFQAARYAYIDADKTERMRLDYIVNSIENYAGTVAEMEASFTNIKLAAQQVPVLSTLALKSFAEDGTEVTDGSIKDDGYYRIGAGHLYTSDPANTYVMDQMTGLIWYDGNSVTLNDYNYSEAVAFCATESAGALSWRIPTNKELNTIVLYGQEGNNLHPATFVYSDFQSYFSRGVNPYTENVNLVNFWQGTNSVAAQDFKARVRCVSGSMKEHSFERNDTLEIVMDQSSNLMWQDNNNLTDNNKSWIEAIDYCETLELGGYTDWRLPNLNELFSTLDQNETTTYGDFDPAFLNTTWQLYWTSTTVLNNGTTYARLLRTGDGLYQPYVASALKSSHSLSNYVRCVRGNN